MLLTEACHVHRLCGPARLQKRVNHLQQAVDENLSLFAWVDGDKARVADLQQIDSSENLIENLRQFMPPLSKRIAINSLAGKHSNWLHGIVNDTVVYHLAWQPPCPGSCPTTLKLGGTHTVRRNLLAVVGKEKVHIVEVMRAAGDNYVYVHRLKEVSIKIEGKYKVKWLECPYSPIHKLVMHDKKSVLVLELSLCNDGGAITVSNLRFSSPLSTATSITSVTDCAWESNSMGGACNTIPSLALCGEGEVNVCHFRSHTDVDEANCADDSNISKISKSMIVDGSHQNFSQCGPARCITNAGPGTFILTCDMPISISTGDILELGMGMGGRNCSSISSNRGGLNMVVSSTRSIRIKKQGGSGINVLQEMARTEEKSSLLKTDTEPVIDLRKLTLCSSSMDGEESGTGKSSTDSFGGGEVPSFLIMGRESDSSSSSTKASVDDGARDKAKEKPLKGASVHLFTSSMQPTPACDGDVSRVFLKRCSLLLDQLWLPDLLTICDSAGIVAVGSSSAAVIWLLRTEKAGVGMTVIAKLQLQPNCRPRGLSMSTPCENGTFLRVLVESCKGDSKGASLQMGWGGGHSDDGELYLCVYDIASLQDTHSSEPKKGVTKKILSPKTNKTDLKAMSLPSSTPIELLQTMLLDPPLRRAESTQAEGRVSPPLPPLDDLLQVDQHADETLLDLGLQQWLENKAGLSGRKLQIATDVCREEALESMAELLEMKEQDQLRDIFKQTFIRSRIERALEAHSGDTVTQITCALQSVEATLNSRFDEMEKWFSKMQDRLVALENATNTASRKRTA